MVFQRLRIINVIKTLSYWNLIICVVNTSIGRRSSFFKKLIKWISMSLYLIFLIYFYRQKSNKFYTVMCLDPKDYTFNLKRPILLDYFFPFELSMPLTTSNNWWFPFSMSNVFWSFGLPRIRHELDWSIYSCCFSWTTIWAKISVAGIWIICCTSFSYSRICRSKWGKLFSFKEKCQPLSTSQP